MVNNTAGLEAWQSTHINNIIKGYCPIDPGQNKTRTVIQLSPQDVLQVDQKFRNSVKRTDVCFVHLHEGFYALILHGRYQQWWGCTLNSVLSIIAFCISIFCFLIAASYIMVSGHYPIL